MGLNVSQQIQVVLFSIWICGGVFVGISNLSTQILPSFSSPTPKPLSSRGFVELADETTTVLSEYLPLKKHINVHPRAYLDSILPVVADSNKTVVFTVASYGYKDMLMSWVCRLRQLSINNFLVCALDYETYQFSIIQGLNVFMDTIASPSISLNDCHFGTTCFQRVSKAKSRLVLQILKLGYNVLLSDVDIYWFQNPLPLIDNFGPAVLVAQSDEYRETGPINLPHRLNSGFYFAHSDNSTVAAMQRVVKHAASSHLSEQRSFYNVLCGEDGINRVGDDKCFEPTTNLTVQFLDRHLFLNGGYERMWEKENMKVQCMSRGCIVIHNNWIHGRRKKLERQGLQI